MIMEEAIHLWGLEYENSLFSAQLCSEPRTGSFFKKMYTVQKWMDSIADTSIESNIQTKKFPFVTHGYTVCISFIKDM